LFDLSLGDVINYSFLSLSVGFLDEVAKFYVAKLSATLFGSDVDYLLTS